MKKNRPILAAIGFFFLAWWAASFFVEKVLHLPIMPSPILVLGEFYALLFKGLGIHALYSLYRVGMGVGISWITAGILGMAMGQSSLLDRLLAPLAYLLYPAPKIAFLPVIMLFLGMGESSRIFIIGLIIFFQILIATRDKVREIRKEDLYSIQSLGAGRWDIFRHVILPACLPGILSALRVSLGTAMAVLFMAEYAGGTNWGIGYLIMDAFSRIDYPEMYAAILALGLLGYLLFGLVDIMERVFCPWIRHSKM